MRSLHLRSTARVCLTSIGAVLLAGAAHATTFAFDDLSPGTTPALVLSNSSGGVTITGSADISLNGSWLGVVGGSDDFRVDATGAEFVELRFDEPRHGVSYLVQIAGAGDWLVEIFGEGDALLTTLVTHGAGRHRVSGHVVNDPPIAAFRLTPIDGSFGLGDVRFIGDPQIPEPATLALLGAGLAALSRPRHRER
jgi:hypothetical protein